MDLNPHKFLAPYSAYEFSTNALSSSTELLLLSMAWLTNMPSEALQSAPTEPDLDTLGYWLGRLQPLVQDVGKEVIVVVANRCGEEGLVVGDTDESVKWVVRLREREESGEDVEEDEV